MELREYQVHRLSSLHNTITPFGGKFCCNAGKTGALRKAAFDLFGTLQCTMMAADEFANMAAGLYEKAGIKGSPFVKSDVVLAARRCKISGYAFSVARM